MYCRHCGTAIDDNASFCTNCGAQVIPAGGAQGPSGPGMQAPAQPPVQPSPYPSAPAPKRPRRWPAIVAVIIAVIVVVGVGGFIAYQQLTPLIGHSSQSVTGGAGANGATSAKSAEQDEQAAGEPEPTECTLSYEKISGSDEFTYPVIAASKPNDAVDKLNAGLLKQAQKVYDDKPAKDLQPSEYDRMYITNWNSAVTYFDDGVVGIRNSWYSYAGGAHGQAECSSQVVDLNTGKAMDVTEFVGLSTSDRDAMTRKLVDEFYKATGGSDIYKGVSDVFKYSSVQDYMDNRSITYFLSPDGVYAWFGPYVLGSYAYGPRLLLMCDTQGKYIGKFDTTEKDITVSAGATMTLK